MEKINISIKKLPHFGDLELPHYATTHSAGMDLKAAIKDTITIEPSSWKLVPTGISIALPDGYEAQIRSRSGLAHKHGMMVLNSPGTIDADYRGEVCVILMNLGHEAYTIQPGHRIAQMVITNYIPAQWNVVDGDLPESGRGNGGLGSTGVA